MALSRSSPSTRPGAPEPPPDCPLCPRLVAFRERNRAAHPDWFNAPVPSFGKDDARVLIVGLAPGLKGANRTGRPFLGDYAGELLYRTLLKVGLARGHHDVNAPEALQLKDCMITNAVRCVPPANRPERSEIVNCRQFLDARIGTMRNLRVILAVGRIAHEATLDALSLKRGNYPFSHGARHELPSGVVLFDSYHCSRQNTNTGRLTAAMFERVLNEVTAALD